MLRICNWEGSNYYRADLFFFFLQQRFSFLKIKDCISNLFYRCRETGIHVDESLFPAVYNNEGLLLKVSKV